MNQAHRRADATGAANPKPIPSQGTSLTRPRQSDREIAERVFAYDIREIIAGNLDIEKGDLFPRLCGRLNLDDETWEQYQAIGRKS